MCLLPSFPPPIYSHFCTTLILSYSCIKISSDSSILSAPTNFFALIKILSLPEFPLPPLTSLANSYSVPGSQLCVMTWQTKSLLAVSTTLSSSFCYSINLFLRFSTDLFVFNWTISSYRPGTVTSMHDG